MLVVDLYTLQAINGLDLVHNVFLCLHRTQDIQDIGGRSAAVGKTGTGLHIVVLLNQDLLGHGNLVVAFLAATVLHDDLTLTALNLAHEHLTVDFGEDGGV